VSLCLFEIKTEADSDDITVFAHDDQTNTGMCVWYPEAIVLCIHSALCDVSIVLMFFLLYVILRATLIC